MLMKSLWTHLYVIFFLIFISGCGEENNHSYSESGSAEFSIIWADETTEQRAEQAIGNPTVDCTKRGISTISVDVYDGSSDGYLTGNIFSCQEGGGTVSGIPVGSNRQFVISGKNLDGKMVYKGERDGITITSGKITSVGYIMVARVNNSAPIVTIHTPSENNTVYTEGDRIEFFGTGEDVEDGELYGDALVWTSDKRGEIGIGPTLQISDLRPTGIHRITLTATDNDNATGRSSIVISISEKNNEKPVANIIHPCDGKTYDYLETILFEGSGEDIEDGELFAGDLTWESDKDGLIEEGRRFSSKNLSPGTHVITFTAVDTQGGIATDTVTITIDNDRSNGFGMTFKGIRPGTFYMGSPCCKDSTPHEVTLTQPFYIQTTELTQGQWEAVLTKAETRGISLEGLSKKPSHFSACGADCPVERVSWDDVQTFTGIINQLGEGTYRLPTEAEWEYMARADGPFIEFADGWIGWLGWYRLNSGVAYAGCIDMEGSICIGTHPVAGKQPNDWGIYDTHGNVWEWVEDDYTFYSNYGVPNDGSAWIDTPRAETRVFRGGSYSSYAEACLSSSRNSNFPEARYINLGFRLALSRD